MDKNLKEWITIRVKDEKEQLTIGNFIHEQLQGNEDYINGNIVLNIDVNNEINLYIYEECVDVPVISI